MVITGVPLTKPLVGKWSFDYLAEHYGGPSGLNVHFTPRSTAQLLHNEHGAWCSSVAALARRRRLAWAVAGCVWA